MLKRYMINGFINLNKPATWTSHDCVARIRRLLQTKKIGHCGTLDPLATGVLPIAVGRATRLIQYLPARKAYRAVIRFGVTTATDDLEGDILTQQSAADLSLPLVEAALPQFLGTINQVPPMYSAIQVGGQRLYDLARKGKTVDVPMRQVVIHQLMSQGWSENPAFAEHPELVLDIDCGPGTYIRSLARDLGEAVGTGATLAQLTRTHSNGFDLDGSLTLEAVEQGLEIEKIEVFPAGQAVAHLPAIALSPALSRRWCMGQKLAFSPKSAPDMTGEGTRFAKAQTDELISPPLRILNVETGQFLGIGEVRWVPPVRSEASAEQPVEQINENTNEHTNANTGCISVESPLSKASIYHPILAAKCVFLAVD